MNALAERYVKLVLALGQHDTDYVDAYYGPPEWKREAEAAKLAARRDRRAGARRCAPTSRKLPPGGDEMSRAAPPIPRAPARRARGPRPHAQRRAADVRRGVEGALRRGRADASGSRTSSRSSITLEKRFPGQGSLVARYDAWRRPFVIPRDEARRGVPDGDRGVPRAHASQHVTLPAGRAASPSSTSPTSRGAATTGTRATTAA